MHVSTAERITGLEITRTIRDGHTVTIVGVDRDLGEEIARLSFPYHLESDGVTRLISVVYRIRSEQTRREQDYRCFHCDAIKPLEIDHILERGSIHGRDDRRVNLRALCVDCHRIRHHQRQALSPHGNIVRRMAAISLQWGGEETGWIRLKQPPTSAQRKAKSA